MPESHTTPEQETIIVLPSGGIHTRGERRNGPEDAHALIDSACTTLLAQAAQQDQTIWVSIAQAEGSVHHYKIAANGTMVFRNRPPAPSSGPVAAYWTDGIPEDTGMLDTVRAAHRAGQWTAAQAAADRATQQQLIEHGPDHPYVVMGQELQAHFALMASDWNAAATLYTTAATACHRLNGPPSYTSRYLANAVAAWLRRIPDHPSFSTGYALAHALVRIQPHNKPALGALLRRLP